MVGLSVEHFAIAGPKLIKPKRFGDDRGFFSETYSARSFAKIGLDLAFVQDNHSWSALQGTIRGLHFQIPPFAQAKLVRVARGRVLDVVVDIRKSSPTYGQRVEVELSADNWAQLFVPVGFAHGLCTLEPNTEVLYKVSSFYAPECDCGIRWNDPDLGISWPAYAGSQTSPKDASLPLLSEIDSPFIYEGA